MEPVLDDLAMGVHVAEKVTKIIPQARSLPKAFDLRCRGRSKKDTKYLVHRFRVDLSMAITGDARIDAWGRRRLFQHSSIVI